MMAPWRPPVKATAACRPAMPRRIVWRCRRRTPSPCLEGGQPDAELGTPLPLVALEAAPEPSQRSVVEIEPPLADRSRISRRGHSARHRRLHRHKRRSGPVASARSPSPDRRWLVGRWRVSSTPDLGRRSAHEAVPRAASGAPHRATRDLGDPRPEAPRLEASGLLRPCRRPDPVRGQEGHRGRRVLPREITLVTQEARLPRRPEGRPLSLQHEPP
jgi:hypothetical protein